MVPWNARLPLIQISHPTYRIFCALQKCKCELTELNELLFRHQSDDYPTGQSYWEFCLQDLRLLLYQCHNRHAAVCLPLLCSFLPFLFLQWQWINNTLGKCSFVLFLRRAVYILSMQITTNNKHSVSSVTPQSPASLLNPYTSADQKTARINWSLLLNSESSWFFHATTNKFQTLFPLLLLATLPASSTGHFHPNDSDAVWLIWYIRSNPILVIYIFSVLCSRCIPCFRLSMTAHGKARRCQPRGSRQSLKMFHFARFFFVMLDFVMAAILVIM